MHSANLVKLLVPPSWRRAIRERTLFLRVRHLYGPEAVELSSNEAAVTCVVKNGEFYVEEFIRHYSKMGFKHIFFLDNGSTDKTIPLLRKYDNVSIFQSTLSIQTYQGLFKKYLAQRSVRGGWCLDADIDEFFDYPKSATVPLKDFLNYLLQNEYTAVITQLLDMFSPGPLSSLTKTQREDLQGKYQFYDISDVQKTPYKSAEISKMYGLHNEVSNPATAIFYGGIRKALYQDEWMVNCLLTKHSLFRPQEELQLFPHVHFVNEAKLADVSCVMLHYKLTSNALDTARQNKDGFVSIGKGYANFIDALVSRPDHQLRTDTAVRYRSVDELLESGFLYASAEYCCFVITLQSQAVTVQ